MELPLTKVPAKTQDPKNLILYGVPKCGKTTLLSTLEDCLLLDLEQGSNYLDAVKIQVDSLQHLIEVCKAIKEQGKPYKFIAIDTVTSLEEFAKPLALKEYQKSVQGANYDGDITLAPMGAGYGYIRIAVEKILDMISKVTSNIILVGHVRDKAIVNNLGAEVGNVKDFDLSGKLGRILSAKSDAIGFIFRDEDSNLVVDFTNGGEVTAGARPVHLANKKIIVAEKQGDKFISHWDRIYPSLKKKDEKRK